MHTHTLEAYREMRPAFNPREQAILAQIRARGPQTDRELCRALGFHERNAVAPRITHLVALGALEEIGATDCTTTGKRVRIVGLPRVRPAEQLELLRA